MKVVAFTDKNGMSNLGALEGSVIRTLDGGWADLRLTDITVPTDSVDLGIPINPRSIVCVGLNYRMHAIESGLSVPTAPALFTKLTSSLAKNGDNLAKPALTSQLDYEAELGVVIGRTARNVSTDEALGHVAGYIAVNDVSARDLQSGEAYGWVRGKSADTFCPVGTFVLTADEVPDPQALRVRCFVNGELRQDAVTADMIFSVAEIISYISQTTTLRTGDLVCTGTPSGVAAGMNPPRFLADGDVVAIEIDSLGRLENAVKGGGF
jgi:2-keto-4-pentenoate hydratase/2-oxohepta-3-ene-1,7-dioic acid hydratase in catechol pathway